MEMAFSLVTIAFNLVTCSKKLPAGVQNKNSEQQLARGSS
jgi:hypothetical protein